MVGHGQATRWTVTNSSVLVAGTGNCVRFNGPVSLERRDLHLTLIHGTHLPGCPPKSTADIQRKTSI
jgi:hypothetical protein